MKPKMFFAALVVPFSMVSFAHGAVVEETGATRQQIIGKLYLSSSIVAEQLEREFLKGAEMNLMCEDNNPGHGADIALSCKLILYVAGSSSAVPYIEFKGRMDAVGEQVIIDQNSTRLFNF